MDEEKKLVRDTLRKKSGKNNLVNFCQILAVRVHIKLALYKLSTLGTQK